MHAQYTNCLKENAVSQTTRRKEKWVLSFNPTLKRSVINTAKLRGIHPVTLLENLVREILNPYGHTSVNDSATYVSALRKQGHKLSDEAILDELTRCRLIALSDSIAARYSELRRQHPSLDKGDALIAATALVKHLPLMTRNKRHFRMVTGLTLFGE